MLNIIVFLLAALFFFLIIIQLTTYSTFRQAKPLQTSFSSATDNDTLSHSSIATF
jgi:hypothetical protein